MKYNKLPTGLFLFMIIIFIFNTSYILASGLKYEKIYHKHVNKKRIYYEKVNPSGCTTGVVVDKGKDYFFINHDIRCKVEKRKRENLEEIADSAYDIFVKFGLLNEIKLKKYVYVNIGWLINHEPLLLFINEDEQWPDNIYTYSANNSAGDEDEKYAFYKETVRKEILKSKIFTPLSVVMKKINCRMTLKEDFTDGLPFNKNKLTKDILIKQGVLEKEEAKKDEYPVLKGAIEFYLNCS